MQTKGFHFAYRMCGAPPTVQEIVAADTAYVKGDMVNLESGQADLGVTTDANFLGAVQKTYSGLTAGTSTIEVIVDADAVYAVYDANARVKGATLDLSGATGAQTVAASSNKEFVVVADSAADEPTYVRFNVGKHHDNVAQ